MSATNVGTPAFGQLAGHQLQRLGLAGAGRAGNQAVAVEDRQRDLDARAVERLAVLHRAAQHERRLVRAS